MEELPYVVQWQKRWADQSVSSWRDWQARHRKERGAMLLDECRIMRPEYQWRLVYRAEVIIDA